MKCPKCGTPMRPSKKYPGYYLCDTCRKRYPGTTNTQKKSPQPSPLPQQHSKKKRSKLPLLLVFLILITVGGFFLCQSGILFPEDTSGLALSPSTSVVSVDETASLNGLDLKILSTKTTTGTKLIKPEKGNIFLLIEVEITNTNDTACSIRDVSNFSAKYQKDTIEHHADAYRVLSSKKTRITGTLNSNDVLNGYLCYEVPEDFDTIEIEFSYPIWYNQKVAFSITQ